MPGKSRLNSQAGGRPPAAVEVAPEGVLAAARPAALSRRVKSGSSDALVYAFAPLPAGALVPGLEEPNMRSTDAVVAAIRSALSEVSPRSRAVTLVLPDPLVRVFVLDFDALPPKVPDAVSVVRFRLRKMVPFEVEHAGVSFQVLAQDKEQCRVLAAVVPGPILAEYEAAVRAAGYEPGAVLSSSLAALDAVDSIEAILAANLSSHALTTSIANGQDLLLYRTLDLSQDPSLRIAEIQQGIAVASAYFEDRLGSRPRRIYYAGIQSPAQFAALIPDPELTVVEWSQKPEEGAMTSLPQTSYAGLAGALALRSAMTSAS